MTESKNITSSSDESAQIDNMDRPPIDEIFDLALLRFFNFLVGCGANRAEATGVVAAEMERFRRPPSKRRVTLHGDRLVPIDSRQCTTEVLPGIPRKTKPNSGDQRTFLKVHPNRRKMSETSRAFLRYARQRPK